MNKTRANLIHLYQRSDLLGIYLLFVIIAIVPTVVFWKTYPIEISIMFSAGIAGYAALIGSHYIHLLTNPQWFCLPSQTLAMRRLLFQLGGMISFGFAFLFAFRNVGTWTMIPYHLLIYMSWYMLAWAIGIWLAAAVRLISSFGIPLIVGGFGIGYSLYEYPVLKALFFSPYASVLILLAWVCNHLLWRWLGRTGMHRRYCLQPKVSLLFLNEERAARKIQQEHNTQATPEELDAVAKMERFFLFRINRTNAHPVIPFLWGMMYRTFGPIITSFLQGGWIILLIHMIGLAAIPLLFEELLFPAFILSVVWPYGDLEISHSLLVKQGRYQRFWSALLKLILWQIVAIVRMVVLLVWMGLIAWFLSAADISEVTLRWKIILLLPLVFFPVFALFKILYYLNQKIKILLISIVVILVLIHPAINSDFLKIVLAVPVLSSISFIFWTMLAVILYWICLHRNIDAGSGKKRF